jgi:predicted HicB family RNase H-like nuclease
MSKPTKYRLGPDVAEDEELHDSGGRLVDDAYVESAVEDAIAQVRGRGRPSLSTSGESPLLRVRLSHELDDAVRRAATRSGTSRSEWVRRVLDDAANQAS